MRVDEELGEDVGVLPPARDAVPLGVRVVERVAEPDPPPPTPKAGVGVTL